MHATPEPTGIAAPTGVPGNHGLRVGVVVSSYHGAITAALRSGALEAFRQSGGDEKSLQMATAPGTYELVALSLALAQRGDVDAVVALGLVLTGETSHDRYICDAVAGGLLEVTLKTGVPVTFGVLTCQTLEQAQARSGGSRGNKGIEAMNAALIAALEVRRIRLMQPSGDARP